jgi:hypothetical protein
MRHCYVSLSVSGKSSVASITSDLSPGSGVTRYMSTPPAEATWDAWGPSVTRWTDWEHGLAPCHPGGSRSALSPLLVEVGTGNPIVIRDFHPERVRRALARSKGPLCFMERGPVEGGHRVEQDREG